jgi:hypothetical protein
VLLVGAASRGHTGLQCGSRPGLGFSERRIETMVAVVRRPVEFIVAIGLVYRILRLVAARIDERKRLAGHEALVRSIAAPSG